MAGDAPGRADPSVAVEESTPASAGDRGEEGFSPTEVLPSAADVGELIKGPARDTSLDSFLADLSGLGASGGSPSVSVTWSERRPLPELAGDVLRTYAREDGVSLAAEGYVDLRGNVWCALVQDGVSWCDLVMVTTEDDERSTARVTRMFAGDFGEESG